MIGTILYHESSIETHFRHPDGRQFTIKVAGCGEGLSIRQGRKELSMLPMENWMRDGDEGHLHQSAVDFACDVITGITLMEDLKRKQQEQEQEQEQVLEWQHA